MRTGNRLLGTNRRRPETNKAEKRFKVSTREITINLILIFISTFAALLLSELTLRLMDIDPMYVSPERDRFWKYDPVLGWAHEPGQEGIFETENFSTSVRINEKGLRDREHSYERQSDLPRIVVLGDSFVWGYGVEESERFSQRLEQAIDVEVINAGVSGYSTDQELLWYGYEGIKYETDMVILVFAGNDIGDNDRQLVSNIYYKPRFVIEGDQLIPVGYPVPRTSLQGRLIYFLSQRSSLAYFLIQRYYDVSSLYSGLRARAEPDVENPSLPDTGADEKPFRLTLALINEISSLAESRQAKFMIVTTKRWWNSPSGETYEEFVTTMQNHGFLVLDVESMPGFDPQAMLIPDDGHWNQAGHEFVAKRILEVIDFHGLLGRP